MTEVRDWNKDMERVELSRDLHEKYGAIVADLDPKESLNEVLGYWLQQYAAEKERADKAERKEQKLKESLEHCIEQYPLYDSKEIGASLMIDFMKNILSILYPIDKEEEAK